MKLGKHTELKSRPKAVDLLGEQPPELIFDPDQDVPQERWNELALCLQWFIGDPNKNLVAGRLVCTVASVMPVLMAQLRQNREFREAVHLLVTADKYAEKNIQDLPTRDFFLVFPEFLSELKFTHQQVTAELGRLDRVIEHEMVFGVMPWYVHLLQLFPQYQAEIRSRFQAQREKIWSFVEGAVADHNGSSFVLAHLRLLFPEKKAIIESWVRPMLGEELRRIKERPLGVGGETIQWLSIIFAGKAEIASDGTLDITPVKALYKPKELPGRTLV